MVSRFPPSVEEEAAIRPCVGCGYCCQKVTCIAGEIESARLGVKAHPCPFLYQRDRRYWCKLAEESRKTAEGLAIGAGCCSPLNTQRRRLMTHPRRSVTMFLVFCCCYSGSALAAHGILNVTSEPSGAAVSLDGKRIGRAPCKVGVTPGEHTVAASAARYDPDSKVVNIKDGEETSVQLTLLPTPVDIMVKCEVKDAAVYVDGESVGKVNEAVKARPGTRELAVAKEGYKDYVRQVQIPWKTSGKKPKSYTAKLAPGISFFSGVVPLDAEHWKVSSGWRFSNGHMIYDKGDGAQATYRFNRQHQLAIMCRFRTMNASLPGVFSDAAFVIFEGPGRPLHYPLASDGKWHTLLVRIDGREAVKTMDGKFPDKTVASEGNPANLLAHVGAPGNNDPFRVEISMVVIKQFKSVAEMTAAVGK